MKRIAAIAILALIVFSFAGDAMAGYGSLFRRNTERGRIYTFDNFEAALVWNATFFSDDFRREFEKKHIKLYNLDQEESDQFIAEQEFKQADAWEFFVGFYAKEEYKKLTVGKDSFWKLVLITENGEKLEPIAVEQIPITPYEKAMYPYLNRWSKAYRISFAKGDLGKHFELELHSVIGNTTLKWNLK